MSDEYSKETAINTTEKKNNRKRLKQATLDFSFVLILIIMAIFCAIREKSYTTIYLALGIQAFSNIIESYKYLEGYKLYDTIFNFSIVVLSTISLVFILMYLWGGCAFLENVYVTSVLCCIVGLPIIYSGIEVYFSIRDGRY